MAVANVIDITALLGSAQSPDANVRNQAEQQLKQLQESQHASFLISLASELADDGKPIDARRLAGLILKNTLDAKDEARKAALVAQFSSLDAAVKAGVRERLLKALHTQAPDVRHTAALVIAKVAAIDLPRGEWPDLVASLLAPLGSGAEPGVRQAALESLGYVCEELGALEEDYLQQDQVNAILTAVVAGMRKDEPDPDVRLVAARALFNALTFAHVNFSSAAERDYIMQMICEGTVSSDVRLQKACWECLVGIAAEYYERLPPYITSIFQLTQRAVGEGPEEAALQALEFWCTLCEEEIEREDQEATTGDSSGAGANHRFIAAALPALVPLLLAQLTKQEEGQETDDGAWNISMAAGTCLNLCACAVGDAVVPLAMPYVQENIQKQGGGDSWRYREAATFAFGSILEGPRVETLGSLVHSGLPFLLAALQDAHPGVKSTTAWTIGRIFEFVHGEVEPLLITEQNLPQIIAALLAAIKDDPHIAEKVCYALSQLAAGFQEGAAPSSPLSPYYKDIVQALLETAARPCDPAEAARLQTQAFEAVNEVVRSSADDMAGLTAELLPLMVGKLQTETAVPVHSAEAAEKQAELQGLLCGVTQVVVQRLTSAGDAGRAAVQRHADAIMGALLGVFHAQRSGSVHEEAMLAVGAMTYACGRQFVGYMDQLFPVLEAGLKQYQEWQVCQVTIGTLGDITRAIEEQVAPYCDAFMTHLLSNLANPAVHRTIKPPILAAFGDVALAIGDKFEAYLPHVLPMLQSAMALSAQQAHTNDEDAADYNNTLRHGILEAWAGLLNGLTREKANAYLSGAAPALLEFVEGIAQDSANRDDSVWKAAAALLGDVASTLSGVGQLFAAKLFVQPFLGACAQSPALAETAQWASVMVAKSSAVPA